MQDLNLHEQLTEISAQVQLDLDAVFYLKPTRLESFGAWLTGFLVSSVFGIIFRALVMDDFKKLSLVGYSHKTRSLLLFTSDEDLNITRTRIIELRRLKILSKTCDPFHYCISTLYERQPLTLKITRHVYNPNVIPDQEDAARYYANVEKFMKILN